MQESLRSTIDCSSPIHRLGVINILEIVFPLPIDQQLITLVRYNVIRAIATNRSILSLHQVTTRYCNKDGGNIQLFPVPTTLPESLRPTELQHSTPHEPWIDLLPSPRMRDNVIRLYDTFDEFDLFRDVVGCVFGGFGDSNIENNGMLVWADPWHASGWELTEGFVHKWKILIEGCYDMLEATNSWRSIRKEELLFVEL